MIRAIRPAPTPVQRRWFGAGFLLALASTAVSLLVTLGDVLAEPVPAGAVPDIAGLPMPFLQVEGLLVALLLRSLFRPGAWLCLCCVAFLALLSIINSLSYSKWVDTAFAMPATAALMAGVCLYLIVATLYAAEPGRRLGRWVLPAGISLVVWAGTGILLVAGWWPRGDAQGFALELPWPVALATATLGSLLTYLGPVVLGMVGDLRGPFERARARIVHEHAPVSRWAWIAVHEMTPGLAAVRQSAVADERARLAADLHAGVLPSLSRAVAESAAGADPEAIAERLREVEQEIRGLMAERRLVILEEFGIVEALEWLAERAEDRAPVRVELTVLPTDAAGRAHTPGRPPRDVERAAFRVAQLAVDNAVLHAAASTIAVAVLAEPSRLSLRVEDDGLGLPDSVATKAARSNHHGLADMRFEADLVRARFEVDAPTGGGTTVTFDWSAR